MQRSKVNMGGWLITFFILQVLYAIGMLMNFPDSLRNLIEGQGAVVVACVISLITLIAYSAVIILSMLQIILRFTSFLRLFQLAGLIALFGNLIVYVIREVLYYQSNSSFSPGFIGQEANYYWALFVLALFWTLLWSVYFVKSSRVLSYIESREYIDKAIFFSKSVTPDWFIEGGSAHLGAHPYYQGAGFQPQVDYAAQNQADPTLQAQPAAVAQYQADPTFQAQPAAAVQYQQAPPPVGEPIQRQPDQ
ncbi:MAG: hypothetical protein FWD27_09765 [Coriobacteriia bacterium]|nr:hypothetical protein [Coriobacteriia bacterium]